MPQPYILKKSLGQHFLKDEAVCQKIVAQIPPSTLQLLEVGPGGGALTKYLLAHSEWRFRAFEFDIEKVDYLLRQFPEIEDKISQQDFLKSEPPFDGNFTVVGNFPYNISGPILFKILEWEPQVDAVIGMFQKEVARRVAAPPGNKEYGILSVLLQAFYKIDYLFDVPPGCFIPPPKVVSGVIKLSRSDNPYQINNRAKFKLLIKTAFNQRRKTLRNALKSIIDLEKLPAGFAQKRAEQLSVAEFVQLHKIFFE
ncbi:MAG TPA: 16S rRNA (adenine(1518)-N(6)/adenine(1519)-N(6))-dimethyltransferase RsmA [Edaphocola sp.]|nr:16S rRNA (adenine(1518)-N(6)/adenine(1519)-N(6))-dimethyltransferase RsmA [Edaphocola sp.]